MKLLAFETSTEACSVALWVAGDVLERFAIAPRQHAELALPWADALLAEAGIGRRQLDAVAVGRGPGAFTGVRLGVALAQGIALGLDCPVIPVSTLKTLAAGAMLDVESEGQQIVSAIDARMGEVYIAAWRVQGGTLTGLDAERVMAPDTYDLPEGGDLWWGVGTGFAAHNGCLQTRFARHFATVEAGALPRASRLVRLAAQGVARGDAVAPEHLQPAYLRQQVAKTLIEQQTARAGT